MGNYVTLENLRKTSQLGDLDIDVEADWAIDAAEEAIEAYCGRRFYQGAASAVRYYTARSGVFVSIDDAVTVNAVATDDDGDGTFENDWAATDYVLEPLNASDDGEPYKRICMASNSTNAFPSTRKGVKVTGTFGWSAIPARVKQATIIQATRFLKRARSAPFGIEQFGLEGTPMRLYKTLDPDVQVMLERLRRDAVKSR